MDEDDGFEQFYEGVRPRLVRSLAVFCGGDLDAAADAADEALVRALERWSRVRAMDSPEAWTFTVGRNLLRRRYRRQSDERRHSASLVPRDARDFSGGVDDAVTVWGAVAELSSTERETLALRYLLGLTEAEVAETVDRPAGTVSASLARVRRRLRIRLGEDARP